MITQCPKCHTEYTLEPEQLSMAQGKVRCGVCMTVFNAKGTEPQNTFSQTQLNSSLKADETLLSDLEKKSDGLGDAFGEIEDIPDDFLFDDESWANELLEPEDKKAADKKISKPKIKQNESPQFSYQISSDDLDDLSDLDAILTLKPTDQLKTEEDKDDIRTRISSDPIEIVYKRKPFFKISWLYNTLALVLLLTAICQVAYFQFDELSKDDTFRPYYKLACQKLDCHVPERIDLNKIYANHLTIKKHPYLKNIVIADVVLTNQAGFAQPFPVLQLIFTDAKQQVVAARNIKPSEYLKGDISQDQWLPQKQPIHIAIELLDPGPKALGYAMNIAANPTFQHKTTL